MAKQRTFTQIVTIEPESFISYSFNDSMEDEEGHQTERINFLQCDHLYGIDPLEQMLLAEKLTEHLEYIKLTTKLQLEKE